MPDHLSAPLSTDETIGTKVCDALVNSRLAYPKMLLEFLAGAGAQIKNSRKSSGVRTR